MTTINGSGHVVRVAIQLAATSVRAGPVQQIGPGWPCSWGERSPGRGGIRQWSHVHIPEATLGDTDISADR
jgi:hypothetical protein